MKIIENENDIKNSIEKLLEDLSWKLREKQITYDVELNRTGEGEDYFSEIEVTFWHNRNILDVISVIMYIDGKERGTKDSFLEWVNEEIQNYFK